MTQTSLGLNPLPECPTPGTPAQVLAAGGSGSVTLTWQAVAGLSGGYRIYYDQAGKLQYLASVDNTAVQYVDSDLIKGTEYCYVVTAWEDCDGNGVFDEWVDMESAAGTFACGVTDNEPPVFFWQTQTLEGDPRQYALMEDDIIFANANKAILWTTRDPDAVDDDLGWNSRYGIAHSYVSYREVGLQDWSAETETIWVSSTGFVGMWSWVYPIQYIGANGVYEVKIISEEADGLRCEEVHTIEIAVP
jgi:hypothetical protein